MLNVKIVPKGTDITWSSYVISPYVLKKHTEWTTKKEMMLQFKGL